MPDDFHIRIAGSDDIETIARHRADMFADMGSLDPGCSAALRVATAEYLSEAIPSGEYVGWLVSPASEPSSIVGGAGVQRRRVLPFAKQWTAGATGVVYGRQAIVVNVFVEKGWRRCGLAGRLMASILAWGREDRLESLVLHASPEGRRLYEQLGFVATNEMRYSGDLTPPPSLAPPASGSVT